MNKARRSELKQICIRLEQVLDDLEAVKSEEEDIRDRMPDSLQNTERYEQSEAACDCLAEAVGNLEDAIEAIREPLIKGHESQIYSQN